jgi:hypothetical protein
MVSWYRLSRQCDETFAPESPTIEKRDGDGHCDGIVDFCFKSSSGYFCFKCSSHTFSAVKT